jgi:hypothetical protein
MTEWRSRTRPTPSSTLKEFRVCRKGRPRRISAVQDRDQGGAATWQLTDLRRGRKGTDWAIAAHVAGEEFALLGGPDGGRSASSSTTELNGASPLTFRGVTLHQDEADADTVAFTNTGEGKRPYSPVNVAGAWDGSNNLTSLGCPLEAQRRRSGVDDLDQYEVEILSGAGRRHHRHRGRERGLFGGRPNERRA